MLITMKNRPNRPFTDDHYYLKKIEFCCDAMSAAFEEKFVYCDGLGFLYWNTQKLDDIPPLKLCPWCGEEINIEK